MARHFPSYRREPPQKTLAYLHGGLLAREDIETVKVRSWEEISAAIAEQNLLVFSPGLVGCHWWGDALRAGASPCVSERHGVTAIRFRYGDHNRRRGWLIDSRLWGCMAPEAGVGGALLLPSLRCLFLHAAVGDYGTPSSLGLALMRKYWQGEPVWKPSPSCERVLRDTLIGGRADTILGQQDLGEVMYEADLNNAYAAAALRLPAGGSVAASGALPTGFATGYFRCRVQGPGGRHSIGPLPVREADRVSYPTAGRWSGWYWEEEIRAAEEAGYRVERGAGFVWPEWSMGLEKWARQCHWLKLEAEERARDALRESYSARGNVYYRARKRDEYGQWLRVKSMVKQATVAAIGRLGGGRVILDITDEETGRPYQDPATGFVDEHGRPWDYWVKEKERDGDELQIHIASYINAMVRLATYHRALLEREALVSTNYDAVVTLRNLSGEPQSSELGGWKWTKLTRHPERGLSVPYSRALISREKIRQPGKVA